MQIVVKKPQLALARANFHRSFDMVWTPKMSTVDIEKA